MPNPKGKHLMNGSETNKGGCFSKNPQNINKNGRPKKGVVLINDKLRKMGYDPVTPSDIQENYMNIINLTEKQLVKLGNDKKQPMLVRILVKSILSEEGFDVIERIIDRGIGKPKQVNENKNLNVNKNVTVGFPLE